MIGLHAEFPHQHESHGDVGSRNQGADYLNPDPFFGQRGSHQQRAEELAADVPFDHYAATAQAAGLDGDWRKTVAAFAISARAQLAESGKKVFNGPFAHAGHAIEAVNACPQRHQGRQETHRRSGIAHEKIGTLGGNRTGVRPSADVDDPVGGQSGLTPEAEVAQSGNHDFRVFAFEDALWLATHSLARVRTRPPAPGPDS